MKQRLPPKIDEIKSPPVVGEIYRVPSVRRGEVFVPVFGPPHTDVELGTPTLHYHVDIRFLTDRDSLLAKLRMLPDYYPSDDGVDFFIPAIIGSTNEIIRHREMKCLRRGPDYTPGGKITNHIIGSPDQTGLIEDLCENQRITKCGKCPHRGTPLGHQPAVNGVVVCPAHLLKWDKTTGKMIRKTKKLADGTYETIKE